MKTILDNLARLLAFLKEKSNWSSFRVWGTLIVLSIYQILTAVAIYLLYCTFHVAERTTTFDVHGRILNQVDKFRPIEWFLIGAFITAVIGALWTLWKGKQMNKAEETKADIAKSNES
jgi:hypothetical protein